MESAKEFEVSRKVDTYEYESLEKMILEDNIRYSEIIELFTDKVYDHVSNHIFIGCSLIRLTSSLCHQVRY